MLAARIVKVSVESTDSGLYSATSSDVPGFFVAATSAAQMQLTIPAALEDFFRAQREDIVALPIEPCYGAVQPWAIVPRELIARGDRRAAPYEQR